MLLQYGGIILQKLNFTSTIWQPCWGFLFFYFYSNDKVSYNFYCYILNENVEMNSFFFSIQNLKGYVKKYQSFK